MKIVALIFFASALSAAQVNFKVQLSYDNHDCVTGNVCTSTVYRVICTDANSCPIYSYSPQYFSKLPTPDSTNSTQTVTASNTHFTYIDNDKGQYPLSYSTVYSYAVTNTFTANPSYPGGASQVTITTPSGVHQAIINWSNGSCRSTSPCTIQIYRAQCSSPTSCPAYSPGAGGWTAIDMTSNATNLVTNTSAQATTWSYTDQQIVGSTTYAWCATNSYTGASTSSPASGSYSGTTSAGKSTDKEHGNEKTIVVTIPSK